MSPLVLYVIKGLVARPLVTLLLVTSMALVAFTLGSLSAVGFGVWSMLHTSGNPNRVMVISKDGFVEVRSSILPSEVPKITITPGVVRYSLQSVVSVFPSSPNGLEPQRLRGLEPDGYDYLGVQLLEGRLPRDGHLEFIAGDMALRRNPYLKVGGKARMSKDEFTCVGIFTAPESLHRTEVITSRNALVMDRGTPELQLVSLEVARPEDAELVAERIKAIRGVEVEAMPEPKYYARGSQEVRALYAVLMVIFSLVTLGAILATASMLVVVFNRRMAELSALRAIGFGYGRVFRLLLSEIELVTLSGSAVGLVAAHLALSNFVARVGFFTGGTTFEATLKPQVMAGVVVLMFLLGVFSLLPPGRRLLKLDVAQGLREE